MRVSSLRRAAVALVVLSAVLPASTPPAGAWGRHYDAVVHLRHPDGKEETVEVSDLRFVFYERRFVRRPSGFGKPGDLQVRDLPREIRSIQNEDLNKLKFKKIRKVVFLYAEEEGKRFLRLIVTPVSRRRKTADWPGGLLRNANSSLMPHFRGRVGDRTVDFPLPPLAEPVTLTEPVLTQIDILPPARGRRR